MTPRDRPRALAARQWPPHAQPSCPGARRGPASHTARRGEASGGQSRPQTTVCAAVWRALRPSRGVAEARTARGARAAGGRRAGEPAAREGAWPRRAQARSRGQALWSLGAARGGARPREHTQLSGAAVARRSGARLSGPEESPRAPEPPLGVERRWSLGGQHEHLPAPTEPAAGTWAEQDRLRPAGPPQDRQGSRVRRRPLRWPRPVSAPCGMRSVQTFDMVAGRRSAGGFPVYSNC